LFVELGIAGNGRALPVDVQARTGRTSLHGSTAAASSTWPSPVRYQHAAQVPRRSQ